MIKKVLFSLALLAFISIGTAQTDVSLKINHKLGVANFMLDAIGTNNLGHEFKTTRLEYYISRITIIHDGGTETAVPDEIVALVRPEDEIATTIELGNFEVTTIESVKFHIGVYEPINNGDPSLFDESHPLSPKSPSMHWGWASGYRFIAYEGFGGAGFSQNFQLHGLGNENYFEVSSTVEVTAISGSLQMSLNGNYAAGLNDISLVDGTISHGSTGEAKKVLENWRDLVFGLYTVNLEERVEKQFEWSAFPNPTRGDVAITFTNITNAKTLQLVNSIGEIVATIIISNAQMNITLPDAGIYLVNVMNNEGGIIDSKRIVVTP